MKKLSAILLSVLLMVGMLVPIASAADFSQDNITVAVNGYKVRITVATEEDGRMVAYLMNEAKNATYGLDYDAAPTEADGVYTYTFNFKLKKTVPTMKLCIRVGNNVPTTEKIFNYANINDKNSFLNGLDAVSDADLIDDYLSENSSYTSADVAAYLALPDGVLAMVSSIIEALPLATGYENLETETDDYIAGKVVTASEKETLFNDTFAAAMKCAKIVSADEEDWEAVAGSAMAEGIFNDKYFTADGETPAMMSVEDVYSFFAAEVAEMSELSEEEVGKAFDRATLMAIESAYEYGTIKNAFLYFEDKGSIKVSDMTNINALVAANTDTDLWRNVKSGTYTSCSDLIAKAVAEAQTLVSGNGGGSDLPTGDNINSPTSPGSFTGGGLGGSGGGGGAPAAKPTTPVTPAVPEGTFSDIDSVEWAKEAIEALAELGILSGKGDGKFYPNDSVTREEFVKIIVAAFDLLDETAECDFNDVDKDSWSYPYIASANKLGIVTGDGENFNPKSGISRQDMAVIIFRAFEHLGLEVSEDAITFDDSDDIADYAKDAVDTLTAAGIINGMGDGTFAPTEGVTRAQAAKVVYGLLQLVGGGK